VHQINRPLILASASPRRKKLLSVLDIPFSVVPSDAHEARRESETPGEMVIRLATLKATSVASNHPEDLVIGADTAVVIDGRVLGKPESPAEARDMLARLSGNSHEVLTGIAIICRSSGFKAVHVESTTVSFSTLTGSEIDAYISTGSPFDKAGGYGIQDDRGCLFIKGIRGDYYNVMGLPLHSLNRMLEQFVLDQVTV
jgi:nucleoside triphosphate pyrophosphatase